MIWRFNVSFVASYGVYEGPELSSTRVLSWADYFELGRPDTVLGRFEFLSGRGPFLQSQPTVFNIPLCNIATVPLLRYMQVMTVL